MTMDHYAGGEVAMQQEPMQGTRFATAQKISASSRLAEAQDRMWKELERLETSLAHLLGPIPDIAEVAPDYPPETAFHNYARVTEMQAAKLHSLIDRLEV